MKILLLGANGMLGRAIKRKFLKDHMNILCAARQNADYCFDFSDDQSLIKCINDINPDIIINAAAIVDIGYCEAHPGEAYKINSRIPGILAEICQGNGGYLIHISTDHYFLGDGEKKHSESAPVRLVNEYARSKYAGEQLVLTYKDTLVIRTNIIGTRGCGKTTFIEWALREMENHNPMTLYPDFFTSSMHTSDFVRILKDILDKHPNGIYNLASSEVKSKRDFIIGLSKMLFGYSPSYTETSVKNIHGTPRAESLGLDTAKVEQLLGYKMPDFKDTLASIKNEYMERKAEIK